MKTIMALLPNYSDATSFYRGLGPLVELNKEIEFDLVLAKEINWATLKPADILFMQRPYSDNHLQALEMAHENGIPVWVDYDDDLFSVPKSNKAHKIYGNQKNQNNIAQIVAMADRVSVSTYALQVKLMEILKAVKKAAPDLDYVNFDERKFYLIPNAYDERFVKYRKDKRGPQKKLITWRGTSTHDKDLWIYTEAMKNAFSKHLDWTMNFIGEPFWLTIETLRDIDGAKETNIIETPSVDPAVFWKTLYLTSPALVVVPLDDCPFNRSKSNIAWIEGLHAGAVTLAPNWQEWKRPGIINYDNPKDFEDKFDLFMRGEFDGEKMYQEGWKFLKENLTLRKVNLLRELIIKELWG